MSPWRRFERLIYSEAFFAVFVVLWLLVLGSMIGLAIAFQIWGTP